MGSQLRVLAGFPQPLPVSVLEDARPKMPSKPVPQLIESQLLLRQW